MYLGAIEYALILSSKMNNVVRFLLNKDTPLCRLYWTSWLSRIAKDDSLDSDLQAFLQYVFAYY